MVAKCTLSSELQPSTHLFVSLKLIVNGGVAGTEHIEPHLLVNVVWHTSCAAVAKTNVHTGRMEAS